MKGGEKGGKGKGKKREGGGREGKVEVRGSMSRQKEK